MLRFALLVVCGLCSACLTPPPAGAPAEAPEGDMLPAEAQVLWAGLAPGRVYKVGEIRAFEFRQGGQRIGRSWGRYAGTLKGEPGRHRFETRIEIEVPGRAPVRSVGELVLDDEGRLVHGFERSNAAELTFVRKGDVVELSDGTRADELGYAPDEHDVAVMAHSAILHEELMLALREIRHGTLEFRLLSLSGGPPTEWSAEVEPAGDAVHLRTNLGEDVIFREGRIEKVRVSSADLEIAPTSDAWPKWEIDGPVKLAYTKPAGAKFELREVELPGRAEEPELFGEVVIPTAGKGPFPGVLWVSTTGREDRHGFAGPPAVDLGSHEITDALANAGFAVMRFDERGRGRSGEGDSTFLGQVEDAKRGLRTLLVQDEVDPDRIIVVGHGEGGLRALHVVAGTPGIRGVALLAVPGRPYREVFKQQAEAMLKEVPPKLRDEARKQQKLMVEAILGGGEVPPELEGQKAWIREMLEQKPDRLVAQVGAPLLIAQGGKDFEVDPKADVAALTRAAKKAKKRYRVRRYPKLDHLFKKEEGESAPSHYLEDRRVDQAFIEDLVDWARERSRAKS